jgi:hypothetical protein
MHPTPKRIPIILVIMAVIFFWSQTVNAQIPVSYNAGFVALSPRQIALIDQLAFGRDEDMSDGKAVPQTVRRFSGNVSVSVSGATPAQLKEIDWALYRFSILTYPVATFVRITEGTGQISVFYGTTEQGSRFMGFPLYPRFLGMCKVYDDRYSRSGARVFILSPRPSDNTIVHELGHAISFGGDSYANEGVWSDREVIPKFLSETESLAVVALYHYAQHLDSRVDYLNMVRSVPADILAEKLKIIQKTIEK